MNAFVDSLRQLLDTSRAHIAALVRQELSNVFAPRKMSPLLPQSSLQSKIAAQNRLIALTASLEGEQSRAAYYGRRIHEYSVEIYKKYSIPFACIVFILIGAPLGIMARRGTFGVAASLSLGFFLLYWASLIGGEKLADRGFIDPWFGMWSANIFIGIAGFYLTFRTARESLTIDWSSLRRFVPKQWRSEEEVS